MELNEHIEELLHETGLRRTRGRVQVLKVLMSSREPLTHQEVFTRMGSTGMHRVSVYRVLQSLMDAGIVHRIEAGDRLWRFAVCGCGRSSHCHPHFTCRECGRVECLSEIDLPYFSQLEPGYVVEEQEVYIHGICADCSQV
jgi:Fur family ferric uptake transcriptional regulator